MPSDLSPALTTTTSLRISTTMPETIVPGFNLASVWLCSNSSAKLSVMLIPSCLKTMLQAIET